MFETSQQESGTRDTEIVAGVIAVILVVLGLLYYFFIHRAPEGTQTAQGSAAVAGAPAAGETTADPLRDVAIVRFNLGRDTTQTMAMWDLQLTNRSRTFAYKNIRYATNYYDQQGSLLYYNEGTIQEQLEPGEERTISQINDGLYPVGTTRYTIELKGAEAVQP